MDCLRHDAGVDLVNNLANTYPTTGGGEGSLFQTSALAYAIYRAANGEEQSLCIGSREKKRGSDRSWMMGYLIART